MFDIKITELKKWIVKSFGKEDVRLMLAVSDSIGP